MSITGIRSVVAPMGPVRVRLSGIIRSDSHGNEVASINAPKLSDARAELDRIARVSGADKVVSVASDYRRTALAAGPLSHSWRIDVQAWGTAMGTVEAAPEPDPEAADEAKRAEEAKRSEDAERAKDAEQAATSEGSQDRAAKPEASAVPADTTGQPIDPTGAAQAALPDPAPASVDATTLAASPYSVYPTVNSDDA